MSERRRSQDQGTDPENVFRDLFVHAAPRVHPPAADAEEIRRVVYGEWDALARGRKRVRRLGALAAAAAVVAAAVLLTVGRQPNAPVEAVAHVERLVGTVHVIAGGRTLPLQAGDDVARGATVTTGSGQVGLRLISGGSLRVAAQARVTLTAANEAELDAGAVYFDSEHAAARREPFAVVTAFGTLRDVGTQFAVIVDTARLEVGVREGRVALTRRTDSTAVATGEKVTVNGAAIRREPLSTFGADWAWAERLAPPFDTDGRRLIEVLEWVAAQTGRTLEFADATLERTARETVLSGSIDLEPLPKLVAVLAVTDPDLEYSIERDRLLITKN
ncbi:MAG TPA: FecR family protein [Gammaproteobacteria bacterium]|nr:FecR family protein [Gammaproteobacteria bacterium]